MRAPEPTVAAVVAWWSISTLRRYSVIGTCQSLIVGECTATRIAVKEGLVIQAIATLEIIPFRTSH